MIIMGDYSISEVFVNGERLDPAPSLSVANHSPTGFAWGYQGSGPAQLALAILLLFLPQAEAVRLYQRFKFEVVGLLPERDFTLDGAAVESWIARQYTDQGEEG